MKIQKKTLVSAVLLMTACASLPAAPSRNLGSFPANEIPPDDPTIGKIPGDPTHQKGRLDYYRQVNSSTMDRHDNKTATVDWTTYLSFRPYSSASTSPRNEPASRVRAWLWAKVTSRGTSITSVDLLELGAQHREHTIFVRVLGKNGSAYVDDGSAKIVLQELVRKPNGDPIVYRDAGSPFRIPAGGGGVAQWVEWEGFYVIEGAGKFADGFGRDRKYVLSSNLKECYLEVCFWDYIPNDDKAQDEDGGPPPTNPSNLD